MLTFFFFCVEKRKGVKSDLFQEVLRDETVTRLIELGKVSDADDYFERTFWSPASVRAGNIIRIWIEDSSLITWVDQMGNVHGRVEGMNASVRALLIGSHLDTVIEVKIFDGSLGFISALFALKVLNITRRLGKPSRLVKVIAFRDEEGVKFQSTFLGNATIAGILLVSTLQICDKSGVTVQDLLKENSIDITEENIFQLKYNLESVWGYVEVHIEQGPILESIGLPLGMPNCLSSVSSTQFHVVLSSLISDHGIIIGWQVQKAGSICRSTDVSRFKNYDELLSTIECMFGLEGLLNDCKGSGWKLVDVDFENDVILVGDNPWE
ncbi:hypothetical protein F0562_025538 [Nyssa sinensis]|uniref:PB1 domain-containing protein n=1 Tax=Nyssa sinensis TaxID=561372 RepID=A0A5J5B914_9ASTE|nr:hypothetical protein F0562_025538 [Nyssa sinensis]